MLDKELISECIGIVQSSNSVTVNQVSNELEISQEKAKHILEQLCDCLLIVDFHGFYAVTDWAELN
jgi:predicted transcriptional regulator